MLFSIQKGFGLSVLLGIIDFILEIIPLLEKVSCGDANQRDSVAKEKEEKDGDNEDINLIVLQVLMFAMDYGCSN